MSLSEQDIEAALECCILNDTPAMGGRAKDDQEMEWATGKQNHRRSSGTRKTHLLQRHVVSSAHLEARLSARPFFFGPSDLSPPDDDVGR